LDHGHLFAAKEPTGCGLREWVSIRQIVLQPASHMRDQLLNV
jgi:hypothetical protein